jgi:hypothetical protein
MSFMIGAIDQAIWSWLPELTVGLRFGTALIGFCLTAAMMIRRPRRRLPCRTRGRRPRAQEVGHHEQLP